MVAWAGGFSGTSFTREEFRKWLASQKKPPYVRAVVHNTDAPYVKASVSGPQRIANLKNYYQNQLKWSGGPDFFVLGENKVYLGSPLGHSIGCAGWNGNSFHVECEGQYTLKSKQDPIQPGSDAAKAWDTMAWVFAEIFEWMGWPVDDSHLKLHKEGNTTHDCPGALVTKTWFMAKVQGARVGSSAATVTLVPSTTKTYSGLVEGWTNTPGDTLNLRFEPNGTIRGSLPHGTKLKIMGGTTTWLHVETPAGYQGWVSANYVVGTNPKVTQPSNPAPVPPSIPANDNTPPVMAPGTYKYSDFCRSWAKRFEGKMLKAYWDKGAWAVGYGHNGGSGVPPKVEEGMTISEAEAEVILTDDLDLQLHYVKAYVNVPLTQGQVDALVLHVFQQGPGNFRQGKVRPLVNVGKHKEAADMIEAWPTSNAGLKRRRAVEAQIYRGEKPTKW